MEDNEREQLKELEMRREKERHAQNEYAKGMLLDDSFSEDY